MAGPTFTDSTLPPAQTGKDTVATFITDQPATSVVVSLDGQVYSGSVSIAGGTLSAKADGSDHIVVTLHNPTTPGGYNAAIRADNGNGMGAPQPLQFQVISSGGLGFTEELGGYLSSGDGFDSEVTSKTIAGDLANGGVWALNQFPTATATAAGTTLTRPTPPAGSGVSSYSRTVAVTKVGDNGAFVQAALIGLSQGTYLNVSSIVTDPSGNVYLYVNLGGTSQHLDLFNADGSFFQSVTVTAPADSTQVNVLLASLSAAGRWQWAYGGQCGQSGLRPVSCKAGYFLLTGYGVTQLGGATPTYGQGDGTASHLVVISAINGSVNHITCFGKGAGGFAWMGADQQDQGALFVAANVGGGYQPGGDFTATNLNPNGSGFYRYLVAIPTPSISYANYVNTATDVAPYELSAIPGTTDYVAASRTGSATSPAVQRYKGDGSGSVWVTNGQLATNIDSCVSKDGKTAFFSCYSGSIVGGVGTTGGSQNGVLVVNTADGSVTTIAGWQRSDSNQAAPDSCVTALYNGGCAFEVQNNSGATTPDFILTSASGTAVNVTTKYGYSYLIASLSSAGVWGSSDSTSGSATTGLDAPTFNPAFMDVVEESSDPNLASPGSNSTFASTVDHAHRNVPTYLQVRDASGTWRTTPVANNQVQPLVFTDAAHGSVTVAIYQHTDPPGPGAPKDNQTPPKPIPTPYLQAEVDVYPAKNFAGPVSLDFRWFQDQSTVSPVTTVAFKVGAKYIKISDPFVAGQEGQLDKGTMPECQENGSSSAEWQVHDPNAGNPGLPAKSIFFEVSPTSDSTDVHYAPSQSGCDIIQLNSVTGNYDVVGSVAVDQTGLGDVSCVVTVTPKPYFHGSLTFSIRANDGGDGSINSGDNAYTGWASGHVKVIDVANRPSPPAVTMPSIAENDTTGSLGTATTVDDDTDDTEWIFEVSRTGGPNKTEWSETQASLDTGIVYIEGENVAVTPTAHKDKTAAIRFRANSNYIGNAVFYCRVKSNGTYKDANGISQTVVSDATMVTISVGAVPQAPTGPTPDTMPTTQVGGTVVQAFSSTDLDGTSWAWDISLDGATGWGNSVVTPKARIDILRTSNDGYNLSADVQAIGTHRGRYEFFIRVRDTSQGNTSPSTRVRGFVGPRGLFCRLVEVTPSSPATFKTVCPLAPIGLTVTDELDAPGGATFALNTDELVAHASGRDPLSLLRGNKEVWVYFDDVLVFAGPVREAEYTAGQEAVQVTCEGLASYLHEHAIEEAGGRSYVLQEQTAILADLVSYFQGKPGGHLGFTTAVISTSRSQVQTFTGGTLIADAFRKVKEYPGGPEVWIDPDRTVRAAVARGTRRDDAIMLTAYNTEGLKQKISRDNVAATVIVQGATTTNPNGTQTTIIGTATDASAAAGLGRKTLVLSQSQLTLQSDADALAADYLIRQKQLYDTFSLSHRCDAESPFTVWDYGVGDVVKVRWYHEEVGRQVTRFVRVTGRSIRRDDSDERSFVSDLKLEVLATNPDGSPLVTPRRAPNSPEIYRLLDQLFANR